MQAKLHQLTQLIARVTGARAIFRGARALEACARPGAARAERPRGAGEVTLLSSPAWLTTDTRTHTHTHTHTHTQHEHKHHHSNYRYFHYFH